MDRDVLDRSGRRGDQGEVHFPSHDGGRQLARQARLDIDLKLGIGLAQAADDPWQDARQRRRHEADRDALRDRLPPRDAADALFQLQDFPRDPRDLHALRRQRRRARRAIEDRDAELGFQPQHLDADGRRAETDTIARRREALLLQKRRHRPQLPHVHRWSPTPLH